MRNSILHRRKRLRIKKQFDLNLTSMMDILVILVVFLLKSYSATSTIFNANTNIRLPVSSTEDIPTDALNIVIDPTGIIFDSNKVLTFKNVTSETKAENATYELDNSTLSDGGRKITPLYDAMVKARENSELLMAKAIWKKKTSQGEEVKVPPRFEGVLTIQADKSVRYDLLRKVMYTAGAAQYKVFKFITVKKDM